MLPQIDTQLHWSPDAAKRVADQIHIIGGAFNELTLLVSADLSEDEQKAARKFLGGMMGSLIGEMLMPLESLYPHLKRDAG